LNGAYLVEGVRERAKLVRACEQFIEEKAETVNVEWATDYLHVCDMDTKYANINSSGLLTWRPPLFSGKSSEPTHGAA